MHSIILPCYNGALYIEECILSVLSQISKADELIIIDDASTDGSSEIIQNIEDDRIRIIHRNKNGGIGEARNDGLKVAKGKYINFIDADDYWPQGRYHSLELIIKKHECPNVISGKVEHFYSPEIDPLRLAHLKLPSIQDASLPGSVVISHDLIQKIGYFDTSLKGGEFVDLMAKALREQSSWVKSEDIFLLRRIHLTNYTLNKTQMNHAYLTVIKNHLKR